MCHEIPKTPVEHQKEEETTFSHITLAMSHSAPVHNTCSSSPDHSDMLGLMSDMAGNSGAIFLSHMISRLLKVLTNFTGNG